MSTPRRTWSSLRAAVSLGAAVRKKGKIYKKLKVFFNWTHGVSWLSSTVCEYGDAVTIGKLASSLAINHLGVSPASAAHFAIVLVDKNGLAATRSVNPKCRTTDLEQQLASLNSDLYPGEWLLKLQLVVHPASIVEMMEQDQVAFSYYFTQVVCDYLTSGYQHMEDDDVMHLGALLIQQCLLVGEGFLGGSITRDLVCSLGQELGFNSFFPEVWLKKIPTEVLASRILEVIQSLGGAVSKAHQCQLKYIEILQSLDPDFGLHVFKCRVLQTDDDPGETLTESFVLDAVDGVQCRSANSGHPDLVLVSTFADINRVAVEYDNRQRPRVCLQRHSGEPRTWKALFASPIDAETACILTEHYCAAYHAVPHARDATSAVQGGASESTEAHPRSSIIAENPMFLGSTALSPDPPSVSPKPVASHEDVDDDSHHIGVFRGSLTSMSSLRTSAPSVAPSEGMIDETPTDTTPDSAAPTTPGAERRASHARTPSLVSSMDTSVTDDTESDTWEIPFTSLKITQVLGSGEFGEVQKGMWKQTRTKVYDVAVKMVKKSAVASANGVNGEKNDDKLQEFVQELVDEAVLMQHLLHAHIVTLYGISMHAVDDMPMIIMEFMPLGELKDYIMLRKRELKETTLAMNYVCQVAQACAYLHDINVIHRDLAARNILVKTPEVVKVADFGLSRYCEDTYMIRGQKKMPLKWMAPECINFRRHTRKSDVWMFAVCAWEIMSYGKKPFQTLAVKKYIAEIQRGVRLQKPLGCPQPLYDVLLSCWRYDSNERPTFSDIVARVQAVLAVFPSHVITDAKWAALGGGARREETDTPTLPARALSPIASPPTAAAASPFGEMLARRSGSIGSRPNLVGAKSTPPSRNVSGNELNPFSADDDNFNDTSDTIKTAPGTPMRSPLTHRRMSDPGRKPMRRKTVALDVPRSSLYRRQSTGAKRNNQNPFAEEDEDGADNPTDVLSPHKSAPHSPPTDGNTDATGGDGDIGGHAETGDAIPRWNSDGTIDLTIPLAETLGLLITPYTPSPADVAAAASTAAVQERKAARRAAKRRERQMLSAATTEIPPPAKKPPPVAPRSPSKKTMGAPPMLGAIGKRALSAPHMIIKPATPTPTPADTPTQQNTPAAASNVSFQMGSDSDADESDAMADDDDSDDFTIDLAPNARTTDRKFTFGGLLNWNIYAPKPLGKTVNPKDALSIRVARIVQACVRLKQLGDNPKAADYVPLVIRVVQAFDGIIIEIRAYLTRELTDYIRRTRVINLAQGLGPRLQNFLESAAEAAINDADASHAILWQDTLKCSSSLTVGCVSLCEIATGSRSGGYEIFKPKSN
eukprot:m.84826 g.84826  ORF g.84826 m.84826 type:complete len:1325 (+) comp16355_c0_seq4:235-4209(+)